jgi:WD40 repeat protein
LLFVLFQFVEFDELTDFCIELGMISTGNSEQSSQTSSKTTIEYTEDKEYGASGTTKFRGTEIAKMVPCTKFGKFIIIERTKIERSNFGVVQEKNEVVQSKAEQYRLQKTSDAVKEQVSNARCFDTDGTFLHDLILEPPPDTFSEDISDAVRVVDIAISDDMNVMAVSGSDHIVQLWKMDTISMRSFTYIEAIHYSATQTVVRFSEHSHSFTDPSLKKLFSAGDNGHLNVWDWETKAIKYTRAHFDFISDIVELGPSGMVATASLDSTIKFWNVEKLSHRGTLEGADKLNNSCNPKYFSCNALVSTLTFLA